MPQLLVIFRLTRVVRGTYILLLLAYLDFEVAIVKASQLDFSLQLDFFIHADNP